MPTLAELRTRLPALKGLDDQDAVAFIQQAYYPGRSEDEIGTALGYQPQPPQEKAGFLRRAVGDTGISLVKGAIGVPEAIVGVADLATGGQAGRLAEQAGFRPKEARAMLDELLSPQQQAANREVQQASGFMETARAMLSNPTTIYHAAVESAPSLLPAGVVARGAMAVAPRLGGAFAAGLGEGVVSAGQTAEQVRQETADGLLTGEQSAIAGASGALTGIIGGVAGKIANKLGIGDVNQLVAGVQQAGPAAQKSFVRAMLEGFATEGVLQELPQSAQEQIAQNVALGKPWDEGVGAAAASGALAGGFMGGIAGPIQRSPAQSDPVTESLDKLAKAGTVSEMIQAAQEVVGSPTMPAGFDATRENLAMTAMERQMADDASAMRFSGGRESAQPAPTTRRAPQSQASATIVPDAPMLDRLASVQESLRDARVRDQVRHQFGEDGLNTLLYYADVANRPGGADGIPDATRERMLGLAEGLISRATLQPVAQPGSVGATPQAQQIEAPVQVPRIGLDTTPTGRMRADATGNVAPETRADAISTAQRVNARDERMRGGPGMETQTPRDKMRGAGPGVMVGEGSLESATFPAREPRRLTNDPTTPTQPAAPKRAEPDTRLRDLPQRLAEQADPVTAYVERQRTVDTPEARQFVRDFNAGKITRRDVIRVMQEQGADPLAGKVYRTRSAASAEARKSGKVVEQVEGGFTVVEQDSGRERGIRGDAGMAAGAGAGRGDQPGGSAQPVGSRAAADAGRGDAAGLNGQRGGEDVPVRAGDGGGDAVAHIDRAATEAATSPSNDLPEPTDAQKEAGNYKKGHVRVSGMDVAIENPKGSLRRSKADASKPWTVKMPAHYGYIKGTLGSDGDHVDLFIGDRGDNGRFWVINQTTPDGKKHDEHKVVTGVDSAKEAEALYKASFSDGFGEKVFGSISGEMGADELKARLPEMEKAKPVEASHQDPGEATEPAAPAAVKESLTVDQRISAAEADGVALSEADKSAIREALERAQSLRKKADAISGRSSDPMNKGNAFPMGVGFTRMTKRSEQRLDASVRRAGEAVALWEQAANAEKLAEAMLGGKGTEADKKRKADKKAETQRALVDKLVNWSRGDKIGPFEIVRVNKDRDGYPATYTIKGDGIVAGVGDKVDVVREFFGGDKAQFRALVDAAREAGVKPDSIPEQAAPATASEVQQAEPASKTPTIDAHTELFKSVRAGTATPAEFKAMYAKVRDGKDAIVAELNTSTKDQLLQGISGYVRPGTTKGDLVETIYDALLHRFALGKGYGPQWMTMGQEKAYEKAKRDALDALVEGQTAESLAEYAAAAKAEFEAEIARRTALAEAIKNPKTLDEYRRFMSFHTQDGKTTTEVRLSMLTPEQRSDFDLMLAEESRGKRKDTKDEQRAVRVAGQTVDGDIIATKHTKKGHDLFVVRLAERVSREDYETLNAGAKKIGGYYSSYRGGGAIPGFQFTTREQAEAFVKLAGGDASKAQEAAQTRRDAYADDRSQTAAERLQEMADALEARADESLNRDRKTNTHRRAAQAASAEAEAQNSKALAKTMRNIAQAIESGDAKFLGRVRQKTQVELLRTIGLNAQYEQMRAKYPTYAEMERHKGEPMDMETADYVEFPAFTAYRSDLASLGRKLLEVEGTKQFGQRLMKVADDVSDAFTAFAKEPGNLFKLSKFSVRQGDEVRTAIFTSRELAERAIKRSGLVGRAIAFQEKRGVHRVIMSPSEAIAAGIWNGDGDKRITLSSEFGAELVEKLGRLNKGRNTNRGASAVPEVPWQFERAHERRKQLARMGIETPAELRAAIREFVKASVAPEAPSKVKQLERAMIGRRNDGFDFFPTPESVADEMVSAAAIEPGMRVLEPSAGWGHIAERIRDAGIEPEVGEISEDRRELLEAKGFNVVGRDFLDFNDANHAERGFTFGDLMEAPDGTRGILRGQGGMGSDRVRLVGEDGRERGKFNFSDLVGVERRGVGSGYDRILMNPPFSDGRDIQHVRHAYSLLKPGGRLVAIMGESAFSNSLKRSQEFRQWLEDIGGTEEKLAEGSFNDPSLPVNTGANARMVVIDKPAEGDGARSVTEDQGAVAFSRRADPEREALRWTRTDANAAGPEFYGRDVNLIALREFDLTDEFSDDALPLGHTASVLDGNTAHQFMIVDHDGALLGMASLEVNPDGEIEAVHDIEITDKRAGVGREVVSAILANASGPVRIIDILDQADAFWQKMGAGYKDTYGNATADWASYQGQNARAGQGRGQGAGQGLEAGRTAAGQPASREEGEVGPKANRRAGGQGMPVHLVERYAKQYEAAGLHRVNVARNIGDLPARLQAKMSGAGDDVRGAYFRAEDQVWLFSDRLNSMDELHFVVIHEAFHRGLGHLFGEDGRKIMRQMYATNKTLRDRADLVAKELKIDRDEAIEEALADMAGEGGVESLRGWKGLVQLIRKWLQGLATRLGVPLRFSDAQIRAFVAGVAGTGLRAQKAEPVMLTRERDMVMASREGQRGREAAEPSVTGIKQMRAADDTAPFQGVTWENVTDDMQTAQLGNGWYAAIVDNFEAGYATLTIHMPNGREFGPELQYDHVGEARLALPAVAARRTDGNGLQVGDAVGNAGVRFSRGDSVMRELQERGEQIASYSELQKLWNNGARIFYGHDMAEEAPLEAKSINDLHGYTLDQMLALPPEKPVFSRSSPLAAINQQAIRDKVSDLFSNAGEKVSWWDKTIGTQYNKAKKHPAFKKVFDHVQQYVEDTSTLANEAADKAPAILPKLESVRDVFAAHARGLSTEDKVAVAAPIFEGTLDWARIGGKLVRIDDAAKSAEQMSTAQKARRLVDDGRVSQEEVDRWEKSALPIYEGAIRNRYEQAYLTPGVVFNRQELRDLFKLNERQIEQYEQFRSAVNESLDQVATADALRLLGESPAELRAMAMGDRAAFRAGLVDYMEERIAEEEDTDVREQLRQTMADIEDKFNRVDDMKARGYAPLMRFGKFRVSVKGAEGEQEWFSLHETKAEANKMARELQGDPQFRGRVRQGVLSEEAYKLFSSIPVESLEMFAGALGAEKSAVFQEYLRMTKNNRSALKRLIQRKGTAGFSDEVSRVLASFVTSNARLAAGAMNMPAAKEAADAIRDGDLKDEGVKLIETVQNPTDTAGVLRGLMFTHFIGGSIASALVNVTQPVMMTLPWLSQWGGGAKAASRLMASARMAAGGKIADTELAKALERAEKDGIVSPQEIHHLTAEAMATWGKNPWLKRVAFIWSAPFSVAEQFNRRVSFLAAYKTAKEEGIADPFAFAQEAVVETQGLYNKGNSANWTRKPIGATALTFKQYSVHYLEWIKRMWNAGEPGSRERTEGRRAVLLAMALLFAAGGAEGLPFAEDLNDLADTIMQALGFDTSAKGWKREFIAKTLGLGDEGADVLMRGLSAVPGIPLDVSMRMGMGNLLPGTGMLLKSTTDASRDIAELAGPAGSLLTQWKDAGKKALDGDIPGAMLGAMPGAIQNMGKAASMWMNGEARDTKGRRIMQTDEIDGFMRFLGFNPSEIARESSRLSEQDRRVRLTRAVESSIADQWARGMRDGDADAVQEARAQLQEWNDTNPESRISINSAQIKRRLKDLGEDRSARFERATPKELRGSVHGALH